MNAPRHSFKELRDRCVKHSVPVSKSVSSKQTTATLARISILNSSSCDIENYSLAAKADDLRRNESSYLPICPYANRCFQFQFLGRRVDSASKTIEWKMFFESACMCHFLWFCSSGMEERYRGCFWAKSIPNRWLSGYFTLNGKSKGRINPLWKRFQRP